MTLSLPDICSHYGGLLSRDGYRRCRLPSMLSVTTGWLNAAGPSALSCASISWLAPGCWSHPDWQTGSQGRVAREPWDLSVPDRIDMIHMPPADEIDNVYKHLIGDSPCHLCNSYWQPWNSPRSEIAHIYLITLLKFPPPSAFVMSFFLPLLLLLHHQRLVRIQFVESGLHEGFFQIAVPQASPMLWSVVWFDT